MNMSKGAFLIMIAMLMGSSLSCEGPGAHDRYLLPHVGTWVGVDGTGTRGIVVFGEDGRGTMEFQNIVNEFQYVFDYSKNPLWLDLLYSREGRPFRAKLIVRFLDENRLQWFTFFDRRRPSSFPKGDAENGMTLTRLNPLTKA
ncbi:MAG: hypothetical protein AB1512_09765 [Thermodesulfobacteriota bacterium]